MAQHSCLALALCGNKKTDSPTAVFEFLTNSTKKAPCNGSITNTNTYCNCEEQNNNNWDWPKSQSNNILIDFITEYKQE
jgi:hypothetical protein